MSHEEQQIALAMFHKIAKNFYSISSDVADKVTDLSQSSPVLIKWEVYDKYYESIRDMLDKIYDETIKNKIDL